ncbi:TonB-dependent receptor [Methylophilus sp. 5]|uniref:TonB-dependent receptor n=1 Tax=Methylophilus sp. 5 TaxID=1112274 RepID=UPI0004B6EEE2|nr:TonB-dependent receptor [Methylophilus sp. 5]
MKLITPFALLLLSPVVSSAESAMKDGDNTLQLSPVEVVQDKQAADSRFKGDVVHANGIQRQSVSTSDTAKLLEDIPGVSTSAAGGISSLPTIHGFADDRNRTLVDGMDLMSACPNHMNPALSFINPGQVKSIQVYTGVAPVSAGGDSIGSTIQVNSARPRFANDDQDFLTFGQLGTFYRSNGAARGGNLAVGTATRQFSLAYTDSYADANNYQAAGNFKKPILKITPTEDRPGEKEVASSGFRRSRNRELGLAWNLNDQHLLELKWGEQSIDWEGFPNQRMDMVSSEPDSSTGSYMLNTKKPANVNRNLNFHYLGSFDWGEFETRYFHQDTHHSMDMLRSRYIAMYMPMLSDAETDGGNVKANIVLNPRDTLRVGAEFQNYRLDDWWPALDAGPAMGPNSFWNIRNGRRDRLSVYSEWEAVWDPAWVTLLGLRTDRVKASVGQVQGYSATYNVDGFGFGATRFNNGDRSQVNQHYDLTALVKYQPDHNQSYELGFARKTRSPNLYELYAWSANTMAALMNNFAGDGNGYVGNPDLKPEVAYTLSLGADWHDASREKWFVKTTAYATYVNNYIDAKRLQNSVSAGSGCNGTNVTATNCYVLLQYQNVDAMLYGLDLSGSYQLGSVPHVGSFSTSGVISYVRGNNETTGGHLYHMMPINAKAALQHQLGKWTNRLEVQSVAEKERVSEVRNEMVTPGYSIYHLRSSYAWQHARLDLSIENLFNKYYLLPLGGAYVAEGNSMRTGGAAYYGMNVPGMGRSVNVAVNFYF